MRSLFILILLTLFSCAQPIKYTEVSESQKVEAREVVRYVIHQNRKEVKDCFDMSLVNKKAAHGQVDLSWLISVEGRALDVKILKNTVQDDGMLSKCLQKKVSMMQFHKAKTTVEVNRYPFIFSSM